MVRVSARLQKEALSFTDERAKLEGELIAGIEVVKCNAWEVRLSFALLRRAHVADIVLRQGAETTSAWDEC